MGDAFLVVKVGSFLLVCGSVEWVAVLFLWCLLDLCLALRGVLYEFIP